MIINATTSKGALTLAAIVALGFTVGILIGHYSTVGSKEEVVFSSNNETTQTAPSSDGRVRDESHFFIEETEEKIIKGFERLNIKQHHRFLTEQPHVAGGKTDYDLARYIRDEFKAAAFDYAELIPYDVLLSKPNKSQPNKITLTKSGMNVFESNHKEEPIPPDNEDPHLIDAFNAYTPAGTVKTLPGSGLVYVNYGRFEDFKKLEELGINITGHIAIVRYGKIFRGNKVEHAQMAGAIGLIMFSDPQDVAPEGTGDSYVYDKTPWLPGTGIQRGTTLSRSGDPLTPGWPSTEHSYRIPIEEAQLAKIPTQPIGYFDARKLLELLDGQNAPEDWQGGLQNLTYKIGPNFKAEHSDITLTLSTHNTLNVTRSYNVIGILIGSKEPDRYVMMGNHRDAWGYGGADPSSGTAQMLEAVRVFGNLVKTEWRPRRTIVFHSWGAEEYGLIGSTEWVEENIDKIRERTVAYINIDTCASGPGLRLRGSPLMWDLTINMTKLVPGIEDENNKIYDEWKRYQDMLDPKSTDNPKMTPLSSGSDHAPFAFYAGIPAVDISFRVNKTKFNVSTYAAYHTAYDTHHLISTFIDPDFKIMQCCGRISALTVLHMANKVALPYSISRLPEEMLASLESSPNRQKLIGIYDKYLELEKAVRKFLARTKDFSKKLTKIDTFDPLHVRTVNDQMMKLEQSFIIPEGLPGREFARHAVFAPGQFDKYSSSAFPGLSDLLHEYDQLDPNSKAKRDVQLKKHISDLTILTDRATSLLEDVQSKFDLGQRRPTSTAFRLRAGR